MGENEKSTPESWIGRVVQTTRGEATVTQAIRATSPVAGPHTTDQPKLSMVHELLLDNGSRTWACAYCDRLSESRGFAMSHLKTCLRRPTETVTQKRNPGRGRNRRIELTPDVANMTVVEALQFLTVWGANGSRKLDEAVAARRNTEGELKRLQDVLDRLNGALGALGAIGGSQK